MSALWTALGRSGSTAEQLEPARGDPVEGLVQEQVQQMSGQRGRLVAGVWDLWKVRRKLHALAALGCDRGPGTAGLWCTGENMSHPGGGGNNTAFVLCLPRTLVSISTMYYCCTFFFIDFFNGVG